MNIEKLLNTPKKSLMIMLIIILGSLGIDQATKRMAENKLMVWQHEQDLKMYRGEVFPLKEMGTWVGEEHPKQVFFSFNFNYVRNQGAAWGTFSDLDDRIREPFFYVIHFIALLLIFNFIKNTPRDHRLARFALTLILSGALGNLCDRILLGYVIDFIDVRWIIPLPFMDTAFSYNFPNFNWADSCISVGVGLLFVDMLFFNEKNKENVKERK